MRMLVVDAGSTFIFLGKSYKQKLCKCKRSAFVTASRGVSSVRLFPLLVLSFGPTGVPPFSPPPPVAFPVPCHLRPPKRPSAPCSTFKPQTNGGRLLSWWFSAPSYLAYHTHKHKPPSTSTSTVGTFDLRINRRCCGAVVRRLLLLL